jgi:hypothetical protein
MKFLILPVLLVLAIPIQVSSTLPYTDYSKIQITPSKVCDEIANEDDEIEVWLTRLRYHLKKNEGATTVFHQPDQETRYMAPAILEDIAERSPEWRGKVIEALIRVIEDPEAKQEGVFIAERWTVAVCLLGKLKAIESLPVLIENLDQTGQISLIVSLHYHPVGSAVLKMEKPAIPYLIEALAHEKPSIREEARWVLITIGRPARWVLLKALAEGDPRGKGGAAFALARIGGNKVRLAIENSIAVETDEEIKIQLQEAREELRRHWGI